MSLMVINEDHYVPVGGLWRGHAHIDKGQGRHAIHGGRGAHAGRSRRTRRTCEQVHALQDAIKVSQKSAGKLRSAELGSGQPEEGARRAAGAGLDDTRFQEGVRHQGPGRSGAAPDRHAPRPGAAIPTRMRPISTSRRPRTTARPSTSSTSRTCRSTASGRSASTTPKATYEKNQYDAYSLNNITAKKKRRRLDRHPVRRLRRQDPQLPADHEGLELHGAALSSARRKS